MESDKVLPVGNVDGRTARRPPVSRSRGFRALLSVALLLATYQAFFLFTYHPLVQHDSAEKLPLHAEDILDKCRLLDVPPGPPLDFHARRRSDRFVPGTKPTLIQVGTKSLLHRVYVVLILLLECQYMDWRTRRTRSCSRRRSPRQRPHQESGVSRYRPRQ